MIEKSFKSSKWDEKLQTFAKKKLKNIEEKKPFGNVRRGIRCLAFRTYQVFTIIINDNNKQHLELKQKFDENDLKIQLNLIGIILVENAA